MQCTQVSDEKTDTHRRLSNLSTNVVGKQWNRDSNPGSWVSASGYLNSRLYTSGTARLGVGRLIFRWILLCVQSDRKGSNRGFTDHLQQYAESIMTKGEKEGPCSGSSPEDSQTPKDLLGWRGPQRDRFLHRAKGEDGKKNLQLENYFGLHERFAL